MLNHEEKQLILCTKGHFEKPIERYADYKEIVAEAYGLYPSQVYENSLMNFIVVYDKLISHGYIKMKGKSIVEYLLTEPYKFRNEINKGCLLDFLLGEISCVPVEGLELGKPDPSYLPLKKRF